MGVSAFVSTGFFLEIRKFEKRRGGYRRRGGKVSEAPAYDKHRFCWYCGFRKYSMEEMEFYCAEERRLKREK